MDTLLTRADKSSSLPALESAILGSLIEVNGAALPPNISRLLANAPESFDDLRHGEIAVAIRNLKREGKPVHSITVAERVQFAGAILLLNQLGGDALPLELAE